MPIEYRTQSGVRIAYEHYPADRLKQQLTFTEITPEDLRRVTSLKSQFLPRVPAMVDAFYAHLWTIPELRSVVERFSSIEKLKKTLIEYLQWFMRGQVDQEYADYRYRVGMVHDRIGLAPQWYLGMFHIFETQILDLIHGQGWEPAQRDQTFVAFMKLLSLDMQLAMDAYISSYTAERTRRLEKLQVLRQTLADSSQDLAASSEESSAASEQLAASVSQVASDAQQVAGQAAEVEQSASMGATKLHQVAETIRKIAEQMAAMQDRVTRLSESSRQMEGILRTVDAIAKQTNLLSLNAAIEAARAGQHGRGFAVVAEEVRKLSDRTSVSLREISKLIADSNANVAAVSETTSRAGSVSNAGAVEISNVEQQFAEIARMVANSAARVSAITQSMGELAQMSADIQGGAQKNAELATLLTDLARQSDE